MGAYLANWFKGHSAHEDLPMVNNEWDQAGNNRRAANSPYSSPSFTFFCSLSPAHCGIFSQSSL